MRVSTVHVRALVEAFESYGIPGATLLTKAGVSAEAVASGYAFVDVAELDALILAALALTGDEAFGLHWGERSSMAQYDLASLMLGAAPTLRAGLESVLPFQQILGDRPELAFDEQGDRARLLFSPFALGAEAARVRADLAVTGFWRFLESIDALVLKATRVHFLHERPSYGEEYDRLFADHVRFRSRYCGIDFPRELLDRPLLRNASVHRALSVEADHVRSRVLAESSYRERVKQQLMLALPEVPDMPAAASAVGISDRSLRRRLEDEGSSFAELVEEARFARCRELLADHSRPIKQVAMALGFREVSSFHRAFKRWTGKTPGEYRAQR